MRLLKISTVISVVLVAFFSIGCSGKSEKLEIGIIAPSTDHLPLQIALRERPELRDIFIIRSFSSGWEVNEAIINGRIDAAIMPFTYAWQGVAENRDVRILSFLERESDGIIAKKEISSLDELENRKIGVLRASTLDIFLQMLLEDRSVTAEVVYFRTPMEMATALTSGYVDALSFYVPPIHNFGDEFHIIAWFDDYYPFHPCCDLVVHQNAIEDKEPLLVELMQSLEHSCLIIEEDENMAINVVSEHWRVDKELAAKTLENQKFRTGLEEEGVAFQIKTMQKMYELGYIRRLVAPEEVYYELSAGD